MQHVITRRFRSRARVITAASIGAAVLVVVGGGVTLLALPGFPHNGILVAYGVTSVAIVAMLVVFAILTAGHVRTVRALAARHPGDLVFLARRLPPVVSDLPAFMRSKGVDAEIGDGWYAARVDARGVAVNSGGRDPVELVLIEWAEIGEIAMVRTATVGGDSRWSVTVDVKPYAIPLAVDIGDAWGIVTMALDSADTAAVLRAVEARRP